MDTSVPQRHDPVHVQVVIKITCTRAMSFGDRRTLPEGLHVCKLDRHLHRVNCETTLFANYAPLWKTVEIARKAFSHVLHRASNIYVIGEIVAMFRVSSPHRDPLLIRRVCGRGDKRTALQTTARKSTWRVKNESRLSRRRAPARKL